METPPDWVLHAIERIHPLARLGWAGGPDFAILELWRVREAPETLVGLGQAYPGHVFGSKYDLLGKVPLHVMDASPVQVFDGTVIDMVKRASQSFASRVKAERLAKAKADDEQIAAMADEWAEGYWHELQAGNIRDPLVPKKFITAEEKRIASGEWYAENSFAATAEPPPDPNARAVK